MSGQHVVIVTGGRTYPAELRRVVSSTLNTRLVRYGSLILFHGACTRRGSDEMVGADRYADDWAQTAKETVDLKRRPADWDRYGNRAGPLRNCAMVNEALTLAPPEHVHGLAFPEPNSRGTWQCKAYMEERSIEVEVWDVLDAQRLLAGTWRRA